MIEVWKTKRRTICFRAGSTEVEMSAEQARDFAEWIYECFDDLVAEDLAGSYEVN
jgi:hypothetical protein